MSTVDIDKEHYLRAGEGTNTLCSCGLGFALSSDAHQHIQYQLANIKAHLKAELLAKMPEIEQALINMAHPSRDITTEAHRTFARQQALTEITKIVNEL